MFYAAWRPLRTSWAVSPSAQPRTGIPDTRPRLATLAADVPPAGRPPHATSPRPASPAAGPLPRGASPAPFPPLPAMPRSPHRTRVLAVRLTRGELATLRARAYVAGVPASTYVRERALAPRRRARAGRLRPADVDRLVPLGTDLNGFARAANTARRIVGRAGARRAPGPDRFGRPRPGRRARGVAPSPPLAVPGPRDRGSGDGAAFPAPFPRP